MFIEQYQDENLTHPKLDKYMYMIYHDFIFIYFTAFIQSYNLILHMQVSTIFNQFYEFSLLWQSIIYYKIDLWTVE